MPFNKLPSLRPCIFLMLSAAVLLSACADLPAWMMLQRQSAITDYRHFQNASIARAQVASPLPATEGEPMRLPDFRGEPFDAAMERNGTVAIVVVKHGKILLERYYNGYRRDSMVTSFSVAKSVVSALVGIAIRDGQIGSVDDPITRYLPELANKDQRFTRITIRNLLEMRSGILFVEGYGSPWADASKFYLTADLATKLNGLTIERAPDERYHYSSGDTQLLGAIIQRATGTPLPRYLQEQIWQPMGAAYDASWSIDSLESSQPKAFCCINARVLDFARFGQLYLNDGRINGRQIVPADWVRQSTQVREHPGDTPGSRWNVEAPNTRAAAYYAWQWRRAPVVDSGSELGVKPGHDFYAEGHHGQFIYVAPAEDMVIVRIGLRYGNAWWPGVIRQIARLNP
ncbi:serine hydrolase domain-containing protein [Massilia glaciei]|uniref:Serine hydrolase n=1 Tax=Massilia glaciei TaxID=1524097 RepID=A0A2U2HHS1_9BURK|nr:serine hydrolase [Massilia glaciei]PWF45453.1 serine hydrolase [Massilia glaciei]